jgi:hypothetical protein
MDKSKRTMIIEAFIAHIRNTEPTDDEYIQSYLQGFEDALWLIVEADQGG